ncbi:hypothetical protein [Plebeiibacterium sediminum]|uniref:Uncharacterized protein n=1 Tax=Plebeiibacterium sediminum TaxID=2992112 RepID=A0AAE3M4C6_9BACT|nr:hypothetical protein [Plebeiobacterium sediminum]MCW3786654.1 hypothetical protein [Plebeiobacterium sediminum]
MLTFQTNIWEKDWRIILAQDYLEQIISRCKQEFKSKEIIVNNVKNRKLVEKHLDKKVNKGVIDKYYFVEDYIDEVLDYFSLTKDSFQGAYYVSSSELVGIYLCQTDYLLYFKGDAHLYRNSSNWIKEGIKVLQERKDILVANATWNGEYEHADYASFGEVDEFFIGYGFSDQCFLVRTKDLKQQIYNEMHSSSRIYPRGNPFEAMVNSYMRNHELKRITHKKDSFLHKNFNLFLILQKLSFVRNIYGQQRLKKH